MTSGISHFEFSAVQWRRFRRSSSHAVLMQIANWHRRGGSRERLGRGFTCVQLEVRESHLHAHETAWRGMGERDQVKEEEEAAMRVAWYPVLQPARAVPFKTQKLWTVQNLCPGSRQCSQSISDFAWKLFALNQAVQLKNGRKWQLVQISCLLAIVEGGEGGEGGGMDSDRKIVLNSGASAQF